NFSIIDSANNTILNINRTLDLEIDMIQAQKLDEGEQDLRGWKKILEKKCLLENISSRNKEIQEKIEKRCEMIANNQGQMLNSLLNKSYNKIVLNKIIIENQDHSRELITEPEDVMQHTEKHFQTQYKKRNTNPNRMSQAWKKTYKPLSFIQENWYEDLLQEISEEEWDQMLSSLSLKSAPGISGISYILIKKADAKTHAIFRNFALACIQTG